MPYATLKTFQDEHGLKRHDYVVEGTFQPMVYFCPDIFRDRTVDENIVEKPDEELAKEYRDQLTRLYKAVGPLIDDEYIADYWMVLTPRVCDASALTYQRPEEQNNFIVTPFNIEEIDLVEKVIIPSKEAGGTVWLSEDRRKRLATNSRIDTYVAVQLNDEHPDFSEWKEAGRGTKEYSTSLLRQSLTVCEFTLDFFETPLRTFLSYGTREKYGNREAIVVEQYFDKDAKKTKGYRLGEGYLRGIFKDQDKAKLSKYTAFQDFFGSRGNEFCDYGLSLEELVEQKQRFKANPWVEITYLDEN